MAKIQLKTKLKRIALLALAVFVTMVMLKVTVDAYSAYKSFEYAGRVWTNAHKEMVYNLRVYGITGDEDDYQKFQDFLRIPLGYKAARAALEKLTPDVNSARVGFLEGMSLPEDIGKMSVVFVAACKTGFADKLLDMWDEADLLVDGLEKLSGELKDIVSIPKDAWDETLAASKEDILRKIGTVDRELTLLEQSFLSESRATAKRIAERVILLILTAAFLLALFFLIRSRLEIKLLEESCLIPAGDLSAFSGQNKWGHGANPGKGIFSPGKSLYHEIFSSFDDVKGDGRRAEEILQGAIRRARFEGYRKNLFLAGILNEIKIPVEALIKYSEKMKEAMLLTGDEKKCVEEINITGRLVMSYIDDIWGAGGDTAGSPAKEVNFDLKDTLASTAGMLNSALGEGGFNIGVEYADTCPKYFTGEPVRIRQIMLNILNNAVKKLGQGDINISVSLCEAQGVNGVETDGTSSSATSVNITVKYAGVMRTVDKNSGIRSSDEIDLFFAKETGVQGPNVDIGKAVVKKMDGNIEVESMSGEASEFKITLKLKTAAPPILPAGETPFPGPEKKIAVALVDDDEELR
ncbi:MAG: hypothetical protein HQL28_05085 [Candidatus Omnitrophica bacterium]|nr:hypothetical protein [Candidatus Omnitrophota bacterium]